MSGALTHERFEGLKSCADKIDEQLAAAAAIITKAQHDQRSLRTALLALQHELEEEDRRRFEAAGEGTT